MGEELNKLTTGIVPSLTPPLHTAPQCSNVDCPTMNEYLRLQPLQHNWCTKTKKYGSHERTDQNFRKRLSYKETDNLSDAEFKTLVIGMLTEMMVAK